MTRLCLSGGVGLNCKSNGSLWSKGFLQDLYVHPASNDAGAALQTAFEIGDINCPAKSIRHSYFGPKFSDQEILISLQKSGLRFLQKTESDMVSYVAEEIAKGKSIGWFQGAMEVGPRALGARSILADPPSETLRDYVNEEVKNREKWRPFAPSILEEHLHKYVDNPGPADFMIVAYNATEKARKEIPATVHVDGTLRPQAVRKESNQRYYGLIEAFYERTKVPALLNTSFNNRGEPIVYSPANAIRAFVTMKLDLLSIGSYVVAKSDSKINRR